MEENRNKYNPNEIEEKWQEKWEKSKLFSPDIKEARNPYYNLMMFPYPSAEGLHVGNMYAFTGADVYARFNRMQGKDVLEPIGLDGFGIHSENYALKVGRHPKEQADISEKNFYRQLRSIGNSFDWERTVETYNPNYYKWTQWLFIQLFKAGLAYRKAAEVNWCPSCKTVLSDEQVIPTSLDKSQGGEGKCERCSTVVERKNLEQWFFRITKYAQKLLDNIPNLSWSEKVKVAQTNWIGRSEGAEIDFIIESSEFRIKIFTTRPDTLFGATFMVLSPEHPLVLEILSRPDNYPEADVEKIKEYLEGTKSKTDDRDKDKTGAFTGLYAVNPVNNEKIPVWIADYVLMGYGTGAIMAVPAHDGRDFEFAKKYSLDIVQVIESKEKVDIQQEAYEGSGKLINSGEWDGWEMPQEMDKVLDWLETKNLGSRVANYHLRDWLISRQRYWGPPIPMVYCSTCVKNGKAEVKGMEGWFSVPEHDLPVLLPDVADWKPMGTGKAPLANHPEFYKTKCPNCGGDAERETDVSDTFLDSSWYFLRYPSTDIKDDAFDKEITKKWLPVDQYIGGAEHSVLHLLYSRFVTMALHDLGYLVFDEPFTNFFAHGLIIKDGAKMSKSKGNVVVPDEYIAKYGADTLRAYLMFLGPFSDGGDFRDSGIEGMNRFMRKVWKLLSKEASDVQPDKERLKMMHKTIKGVTEDIKAFGYNTAIAKLMEWYNHLNSELREQNSKLSKEEVITFLKLLAPFAPYLTEELWQRMGNEDSIHTSPWPQYEEKNLIEDAVIVVVQVNGKRRGEVSVQNSEIVDQAVVETKAKETVSKHLEGMEIRKTVYIPGKIINFVV